MARERPRPKRALSPAPSAWRIENPILRRELLTTLRTGRAFLLAFICVSVLSVLIYIAWPAASDEYTTTTLSNLADALFNLFARGTMVLIAILAPTFAASAVTLEKELNTIDMLKASPVSAGTVLRGKLTSSILYLVFLIISTAPLVSVCLRLPGVEPGQVIGLYLVLFAEAILFGTIGLLCSTIFSRTFASLVTSYFIILPVAVLLFAASFAEGFFSINGALVVGVVALLVALIFYNIAKARYRKPVDPGPPSTPSEDATKQAGLVIIRQRFPDNILCPARAPGLWPDGINPIYMKELQHEVLGRGSLFLRIIIQVSMLLSLFALPLMYRGGEVWFVCYLVLFIMLVGPSFSSGLFTGEKERQTAEMLLTTPVPPHAVIFGKFAASVRCTGVLVGMLSLSLALGSLFSSSFGPVDYLRPELWGYLLILAVTVLVATTVGMFWSILVRTTLAATVLTYMTLIALFLVPVVVKTVISQFRPEFYKLMRHQLAIWFSISPLEVAQNINVYQQGGDLYEDVHVATARVSLIFFCAAYVGLIAALHAFMRVRFHRLLKMY